jgi:Tol biopolymer transport system component
MMRLTLIFCLLIGAFGCASEETSPASSPMFPVANPGEKEVFNGPSLDDRLLLTLPPGVRIFDAVVSADGRAAAYFSEQKSKSFVAFNGKPSEDFDFVSRPEISRNGRTIAYLASKGGQAFVVVNGKRGEAFPGVDHLVLSSDGSSVMYVARMGKKKCRMVVGEKKGEEFEDIDDSGIFAPNGSTFAYVATRNSRKVVVFGDKVGEAFPHVRSPVISPDGSQIAYEVSLGPIENHQWCIVLGDRKLGDVFDYVLGPSFTPDGKLLFAANRGGKAVKELFGVPAGPVYGGQWIIGLGNERRELPASVESLEHPPRMAPDGAIYYVGKNGDKDVLVTGDKQGPLFSGAGGVTFSRDGKSMAYIAILSKSGLEPSDTRLVVNGTMGEENLGKIGLLTMSPDGKAIAYRRRTREGMQVVAGNRKSEFYEIIDELNFSSDSRKIAFCARRGNEIWWKVMDVK